MAELTIEEARKIYSSSDSLKSLVLTKFSKEELERNEVTQSEFDKKFIELLGKCTKTIFLNKYGDISILPTNRVELRNKDDEFIFDICFTGKHKHFWVNYSRVWKIFMNTYSLEDVDIKLLMKNKIHIRFGLDDVTPETAMLTRQ